MYDQATFADTHNATSSPASASGPMHFGSLDGQMIDLFGPVPVRANLSARQAKELGLLTSGTYGRLGSISSASADLQRYVASRLQARTAMLGSTSFNLTWKEWTTPAGRSFYLLRASVRIIEGKGSFSLPTPCARDGKDISRSNAFLSQRERHSPSLATRLLESGLPWQVITPIYCLAMSLPLHWNDCAPMHTGMQSTRNKQRNS